MKNYLIILISTSLLLACTRKDEDVVEPVMSENFPQVILFDDEEGSVPEDSDQVGLVITLADRFDPSGEELGGVKIPLEETITLEFSIQDLEGFSNLSDYLLGAQVFQGSDEEQSNDLLTSIDLTNGTGQLTFPAGAEEVELILLLDEDFFNDDVENDTRGFSVTLSGSETESLKILDLPFALEVEDDDAP